MDNLEKIKLKLEIIIYQIAEIIGTDLPKTKINEELRGIEKELKEFMKYYRAQ